MEGTWIVILGKFSLYLFFVLVGVSLLALALQRYLRGSSAAPASARPDTRASSPRPLSAGGARHKLRRFLLEYVGNTGSPEDGIDGEERRENLQARILVDYIKRQMEGQQVSQAEAERTLERLRRAIRTEDQGQEYSG